jgi:hypothetical protein
MMSCGNCGEATDGRSSSNELEWEEEDGSNEAAVSEEGIEQLLDL